MWRGLKRCIWPISLLTVLGGASAWADTSCPARLSDLPGTDIQSIIDATGPYAGVNDYPELDFGAMNEEGPFDFARLYIWNEDWQNIMVPVVQFADPGTPTHLVLPQGLLVVSSDLWPCFIAPGDGAYLSDGFTDHVSLVSAVDMKKQELQFVDGRAEEIFLLSENSVLEDFGGHWWSQDGHKFFGIPFASVPQVLKMAQLFPGTEREATLASVQRIVPDIPAAQLHYWQYAVFMAEFDLSHSDVPLLFDVSGMAGAGDDRSQASFQYLIDLLNITMGEPGDFAGITDAAAYSALLSPEMNLRLALALYRHGYVDDAAAFATSYLQDHPDSLDMTLIAALSCSGPWAKSAGKAIEQKLAQMVRLSDPIAARQALEQARDFNASIPLLLHRQDFLGEIAQRCP